LAHNVSRPRQESLAQDQRLGRLARFVVPGWELAVEPERIIPIKTLLGSYQRGEVLTYRCLRPDCGRRVAPDLEAVVRGGFGHVLKGSLIEALSCRHPLGCRLKLVSETYPRGVPLVAHLGSQGLLVAITCESCKATLSLSVAAMIERLMSTGRGDASTGVRELGGRVRGPCRQCGGRRFNSTVIWPPAVGKP